MHLLAYDAIHARIGLLLDSFVVRIRCKNKAAPQAICIHILKAWSPS